MHLLTTLDFPFLSHLGNDTPGAIWSIIEVHVGIVSACLPTLRPLVFKQGGESKNSKAISDYKVGKSKFEMSKRSEQSEGNRGHDQTAYIKNGFKPLADVQTDQVDGNSKQSSPLQLSSQDAGIMVTTEVGLGWE